MLSACMQPTGGAAAAAAHMPLLAGQQKQQQQHTWPCWCGSRLPSTASLARLPAGSFRAAPRPAAAQRSCKEQRYRHMQIQKAVLHPRHAAGRRATSGKQTNELRPSKTRWLGPTPSGHPYQTEQETLITAAQRAPTCAACAESPHHPGPWAGWWRPAPARGQRPWCAGRPSAS